MLEPDQNYEFNSDPRIGASIKIDPRPNEFRPHTRLKKIIQTPDKKKNEKVDLLLLGPLYLHGIFKP